MLIIYNEGIPADNEYNLCSEELTIECKLSNIGLYTASYNLIVKSKISDYVIEISENYKLDKVNPAKPVAKILEKRLKGNSDLITLLFSSSLNNPTVTFV